MLERGDAVSTGLHSLTTVGGGLSFTNCEALTTTTGLRSLTTVGGSMLFFHDCTALDRVTFQSLIARGFTVLS